MNNTNLMSLYNIYNPVPTIFTLSHFFGGPDIYLPPRQKKGTAFEPFPVTLLRKVRDSNPRTHEGSTVFETAPIDHSGNFPWSCATTISRDCGCKISDFYRQ